MEEKNRPLLRDTAFIFLGGFAHMFGQFVYDKWIKKHNETTDQNPENQGEQEKPASKKTDAFPLRFGSKGDNVQHLQNGMIAKYGDTILKHGADGHFGGELVAALKKKGYPAVVTADTFKKITGKEALQGIVVHQIVTIKPTVIWKSKSQWVRVAANVVLGMPIKEQNHYTQFQSKNKQQFLVLTNSIKSLK